MMRPTLSEHPGTLHSRDRFQHAVILYIFVPWSCRLLSHRVPYQQYLGATLVTGGRVLILDEVDALVIDEEPNEPSGDQAQAP